MPDLPLMGVFYFLRQISGSGQKPIEIIYIFLVKVQLAFTLIATVLTRRIKGISFNFKSGQDPIADGITPYRNPDKNITTAWFNLLKIHIKPFARIRT